MTLPPSYYLLKGLLLSRRDIVQNPPFDFTKLRILFHCPATVYWESSTELPRLSTLSAFPHVVGKGICLLMFGPRAHEAWVLVSTISRFGWGSPCAMISHVFPKNKIYSGAAQDPREPSASHPEGCSPLLTSGEVEKGCRVEFLSGRFEFWSRISKFKLRKGALLATLQLVCYLAFKRLLPACWPHYQHLLATLQTVVGHNWNCLLATLQTVVGHRWQPLPASLQTHKCGRLATLRLDCCDNKSLAFRGSILQSWLTWGKHRDDLSIASEWF
jgi:hypothetical protein